jgi:hypothetical protein
LVPGVNTGTPTPTPRAVNPEDKTAMNPSAVVPAYYLVSAAQKIASPAPTAVVPTSAVAPTSIITLDDSGWRPARD